MPNASASKPASRTITAPQAPAKPAPAATPKANFGPDLQPGMGAVPHAAGTTFRVWAPNADAVAVIGTFNDWKNDKTPLWHEADGYWAVEVPNAKPGDEYKYHITNGEQQFDRNDPYARQVTNSAGASVVPTCSS